MTKHMFALWGVDLGTDLLGAALRQSLSELGVTRLQVNIDDEAVAGAMRIASDDDPVGSIGAVVSTWSSAGAGVGAGARAGAGVAGVLSALASVATVAGWEVEERRPIDPDEVWDGTRVDALANIALLRRPAELTHKEWLHRWLVDHTPVAIATQATFGYVQNIVVAPVTPGAPAVTALVEELFPSVAVTDIHAFYGSGGSQEELSDRMGKMMTSIARFGADRGLDLVPTSRYLHDLT